MKRSLGSLAKIAFLSSLIAASATAFAQSATFPQGTSNAVLTPPPSQQSVLSDWQSQWRMFMGGESDATQEISRQFVLTRFDFSIRYLLDDSLFVKVVPSASFQSGASETWDGTQEQQNQIYLSEASVTWKPATFFVSKVGALDQSETHNSLLTGQRPFPSALMGLAFGDRSLRYGLFAGSAIPTSMSLTTYDGEREQVPGLQTVQTRIEWTNSPLMGASFVVGGWEYTNLPSGTANESALIGNTITRLSDTESSFSYTYAGVETSAKVHFPMGHWDGETDIAAVKNTGAPSGHNLGWKTHGGIRAPVSSKKAILAGGMAYHLESDAAVASFIDQDYFGTNRNGYYAEAGVEFGRHKTRIVGRYGQSDLVYENDPQSRDQFFLLKLESDYASF